MVHVIERPLCAVRRLFVPRPGPDSARGILAIEDLDTIALSSPNIRDCVAPGTHIGHITYFFPNGRSKEESALHEGQGAGSAMLAAMLASAERAACSHIFTMTDSDSMRRFLDARGFVSIYDEFEVTGHVSQYVGVPTTVRSTYTS